MCTYIERKTMNPHNNLSEQSYLLHLLPRAPIYGLDVNSTIKQRLMELRLELARWVERGGAEPVWTDYPLATAEYQNWLEKDF